MAGISIPALGNTLPNVAQVLGTALGQLPDAMAEENLKRQQLAITAVRGIVSGMMANPQLRNDPAVRAQLKRLAQYGGIPIPMIQSPSAEPAATTSTAQAETQSGEPQSSGVESTESASQASTSPGVALAKPGGAYQADLDAVRQQPALLRVAQFQRKLMADAQAAGRAAADVNADLRTLAPIAGSQSGSVAQPSQNAPRSNTPAAQGAVPTPTLAAPQGSSAQIDVDGLAAMVGLAAPPKSVGELSGPDLQYYMSLPKGAARLQAAQAAGLRGVTPQFVNAPMEPRSVGEVTEFSKELQQERTAVQSGNATPDEWVKFVNDNADRLSWVGMTPQQLMDDPQVLGELTQNASDKIQQLANSGILAKSAAVRASAEMARAKTAADVARVMIRYTGAKIDALPQEVQARVTQSTAALMNAQARAAEVSQRISDATQGTWFQQQDVHLMQQRMSIQRGGIKEYQALLQSDSANLRSLNGIVQTQIKAGKDPTDIMISVPDPKTGAPQQVKLGDALTMAQQRVDDDRQQLRSLASKDFLTQLTPGGDNANPNRTYATSKSGKRIYSDDGGQTWHYSP